MASWTASDANQLRELLGLQPLDFARRLKIHERTVKRWRDGETDPTSAVWADLDNLLLDAARKLAPWLHIDQLDKMNRREILTLLAASTGIPLAGVDLLWNGLLTEVSNLSLDSLEDITDVLASTCHTSSSHVLLGSVTGHLEKASALLRSATMQPSQRQRLETIVSDAAIFVGWLNMQSGKMAQADAHLSLAEKMAHQASSAPLMTQISLQQAFLDYYEQSPGTGHDDPRARIELLEEAHMVAKRHAPPIVQMAINGRLAKDRALAKDDYGAEEALAWMQAVAERGEREGPWGTGFCSSVGYYRGWGEAKFEGFRGEVEATLDPASALTTLETALQLETGPRTRALNLANLARALIACNQPRDAYESLAEAHAVGTSAGSATILHYVLGARASMPPEWSRLQHVRLLDEQLGGR